MSTRVVETWEEEGMWAAHASSVPGVYGIGGTAAAAKQDLAEALALLDDYLAEIRESSSEPRER